MPMPPHCIDCDKVATVLNGETPYCPSCFLKEQRSQKSIRREGHLFKGKTKS